MLHEYFTDVRVRWFEHFQKIVELGRTRGYPR